MKSEHNSCRIEFSLSMGNTLDIWVQFDGVKHRLEYCKGYDVDFIPNTELNIESYMKYSLTDEEILDVFEAITQHLIRKTKK